MREHRHDIDGLRAVAVIPVVLYHAGVPALPGGYLGVDIFFVISGYLIAGIIRDELNLGGFSLAGFYERRARRILPALFFMMAGCFAAGWAILLPDEFRSFAESVAAATAFLSNVYFWRTADGGYFADASELLPLLHTWSLAVEEQFYLLFPLLLLALPRRAPTVTVLAIAVGSIASLLLAMWALNRWPSAAFYLAPTRAWELGLGALVALGPRVQIRSRRARELLAGAGLAAILFAIFALEEANPGFFSSEERQGYLWPAGVLPCMGAAALILAGGAGTSLVTRALAWRPLVAVGLISYSLYLWHWPILAFLRIRLQTIDLPWPWATAAVAVALALATVSWALVERPFRNRSFLTRSNIFALSGAAMATCFAAVAVVWGSDGLPSRIPSAALAIANAENDINPRREECFEVTPTAGLCTLGVESAGSVDFLLWGDSHADAMLPGMERAAQLTNRTGVYAGLIACPPLLGVNATYSRECRPHNDAVMNMLRERSDVATVVLHARWAMFETGRETNGDLVLITDDDHPEPTPETNSIVFRSGLTRTVHALRATGRNVIILGDTPEFRWSVPRRLYFSSRWGDVLHDVTTSDDVARRTAGVERAFSDVLDGPNVRYLSLRTLLCPDQCLVEIDGRPAYYDDDHLTAFASRELLGPFLAREVMLHIQDPQMSDRAR